MIRTLIVEDDPVLAEAHAVFTGRVPDFEVVGVTGSGAEALRLLSTRRVDLVLLDLYLPDLHGLDVCRTMRGQGHDADVIAVTSARDLRLVRSAVSLGVVQYLLKPFSFAAFRERLDGYAEYRRHIGEAGTAPTATGQREVDQAFAALRRTSDAPPLPKGLAAATFEAIVAHLSTGAVTSAADIAEAVGISRPTARRYLDHLSARRLVSREPRYGGAGRPEYIYRWHTPHPETSGPPGAG
ncbi:response regulator [Embleya scabrispora]|uniref:response regulator n=1 Tax=Embleya scabrispora TaxID=159449 RepID=UPI00037BC72B|nr:response regulator [Embleya scabrispora]MYS85501.1 response regulator [Streptomyces sp. SID5474]